MALRRKAVDLSDLDVRPSNRHAACTCGFQDDPLYADIKRYNTDCAHHRALNARLDGMKDKRPFAVRQAEAQANVARWEARRGANG